MQTGILPGNRDGEVVLASEDQPLEVKLVSEILAWIDV